jgi:hypothetical protein
VRARAHSPELHPAAERSILPKVTISCDGSENFSPHTRDDGIALTLLFALSEFDGSREPFRLRHEITSKQLEYAQQIIEWGFAIPITTEQVYGMCRWLRFKKNKYKDWAPLMYRQRERRNNRHQSCPSCGVHGQLCQLPMSFANEHNWTNRADAPKLFGLCLTDRILGFTINKFFQFEWPTNWPMLDVRVKNFYDRWLEDQPFPEDADEEE